MDEGDQSENDMPGNDKSVTDKPKRLAPHPSRRKAVFNPELDTYYDIVDKETGAIEFRKDHPGYTILKSAMMGIGINIDDVIKTEQQLNDFEMKHIHHLNDFHNLLVLNDKSQLIDRREAKARLLGDEKEADRLFELMKKRKKLGLTIVPK